MTGEIEVALICKFRFMSVILGRWPLIPDHHRTPTLPNGILGTRISNINAPNAFCERRLQIELTKIAFGLLTSNHGKPSTDPVIIQKHIRRLEEDFIDKLPPAFKLYAADEKWDDELPNLKRQREMLRISVFVTMCSLLRPVITQSSGAARKLSPSDRKLITEHRTSLINVTIEMLQSVGKLHMLMGGKQNRFFLLSFFTLEPAVLLGMCLMNPELGKNESKQGSDVSAKSPAYPSADDERWKRGYRIMAEAVARLQMLSEVSSIARIGVKILEKFVANIDHQRTVTLWNDVEQDQSTRPTSKTPSRSIVDDSIHSQPKIQASTGDVPAATILSLSSEATAAENLLLVPPDSQHSRPRQDAQVTNSISDTSDVGDVDMLNITSDLAGGEVGFGDTFLHDNFAALSDPFSSSDSAPEPTVTITSATIQQTAHSYASSYADMAWPMYPPDWAWDSLTGATNPTLSTTYVHPQFFTDDHELMAMAQDYNRGFMGEPQVVSFEKR